MHHCYVGTSGWRYRSWRGDFYPDGLPQRRELSYLAERMTAVELNGSFYSLQRPSSYEGWRDAVPEAVRLAVKGSRYVTHLKRLRDVDVALANFFASGVLALGNRLGPVLWQLPARLELDVEVLEAFLAALPRTTHAAAELGARHDDRLAADRTWLGVDARRPVRHALEVRHESFLSDAAYDVLRRHGVATVLADSAGRFPRADEATGSMRYVRLHGSEELYTSGYTAAELDEWAGRCAAWVEDGDVFVFFDNDARGRAPYDAIGLRERLDALVGA